MKPLTFITPSKELADILNPDEFILWQQRSMFANALQHKQYGMQVFNQCNFAALWCMYKITVSGITGAEFCYGRFRIFNHSWIRIDKQYYDLTLKQFDNAAPKLCVVSEKDKSFKIIEVYKQDEVPHTLDKYAMGNWLTEKFDKYTD